VEQIMNSFSEYKSHTCQSSFRFIEGYVIKDIENLRVMAKKQRHLRFFRIIFANARLDLKEDRQEKKMKTFPLSEITDVFILKN
jgi:hypothetical protein